MRFAPTLAHIYILFKSRTGESHSPQSAFAPIFIHPNIYIPSFHPFQWANAIRPYIGTHIYYSNPVRANRIRPNQHSPNIFSDNIKDKFENSVAYTPKDLGFSPAKTRSFGYKNPVFYPRRPRFFIHSPTDFSSFPLRFSVFALIQFVI